MLGWEFPPFFAGGVGVVAEALTRALAARGHEITYVMPRGPEGARVEHVRLLVARRRRDDPVELHAIPSTLRPYGGSAPRHHAAAGAVGLQQHDSPYGNDLVQETQRFAANTCRLVRERGGAYDVIHAHDWTTFAAGIALRRLLAVPLVVHVHITEFDKSGGEYADPTVYALEQAGMHAADRVVAVSRRVRDVCIHRYGVDPSKIEVIHNAVEPFSVMDRRAVDEPMVLFLGRVTLQKGPDHFVEAARRVSQLRPATRFVVAGAGDMLGRIIEQSAAAGLADKIRFTGFVDREQVAELYSKAACFVMPSVSEPFGIVALEAMTAGVPVILSRQSGAAEVVRHAFKVNFWDVEALAARIVSCLDHEPLRRTLRRHADREIRRMTWSTVAERTEQTYSDALATRRTGTAG